MPIKPFPSRSLAVSFLKAVSIRAYKINNHPNQSLWLLICVNLC